MQRQLRGEGEGGRQGWEGRMENVCVRVFEKQDHLGPLFQGTQFVTRDIASGWVQ